MSKDIKSYFTVISKTKVGDSSSTPRSQSKKISSSDENKHTKRSTNRHVLSDSEDEAVVTKEKVKKTQPVNKDKTIQERDISASKSSRTSSRSNQHIHKRRVLIDSEDEEAEQIKEKSQKNDPSSGDKFKLKKIVSAADVFGSKPVKRVEAPKAAKKLVEEDTEFFCNDEFEANLDQLENSVIKQGYPVQMTCRRNVDEEEKNSTKKENTIQQLSHPDESLDREAKKVNNTSSNVPKVSKLNTINSKISEIAGEAQKAGAIKTEGTENLHSETSEYFANTTKTTGVTDKAGNEYCHLQSVFRI